MKAQGKTDQEILAALKAENKEFSTMMEIIESDRKKYTESVNGPELVMAEMEKRLGKSEEKKTYTLEEVEQAKREAAEMERNRLSGIDEGMSSTTKSTSTATTTGKPKGFSQEGLEKFIEAGKRAGEAWSEKDYIDILNRRESIPNVDVYGAKDES